MVIPGMERASRLILELCGGEAGQPIVAGVPPAPRAPFSFRFAQIERLAGIALEPETVIRLLEALGFAIEAAEAGVLILTPPSWRHDVTQEADVVEELARLHGYDKIPPMPMRRTESVAQPALTPEQRQRAAARRALAFRGLAEAVTWSFLEPRFAERFGGGGVRLQNPLNAELSELRPSLLPNLLTAAARNEARGLADVGLFEVGPVFHGYDPGEQETIAGGLRLGSWQGRHWAEPLRPVDVFDARADALAALTACKLKAEAIRVVPDGPAHYHPGRKGRLMLGPQTVLAEFGELHPAILKEVDVAGRVVGFEVFLDRLPKPRVKGTRGRPPLKASPFPPVDRDFAFVVAEDVLAEALLGAVRAADKTLIQDVALFDVYRGQGLEPGQISLAVAVRLQAPDHTLTEAEIDAVAKKITAAANKATGATLRA
jgi:phenylalanyl-tRNA synthetase beta chain